MAKLCQQPTVKCRWIKKMMPLSQCSASLALHTDSSPAGNRSLLKRDWSNQTPKLLSVYRNGSVHFDYMWNCCRGMVVQRLAPHRFELYHRWLLALRYNGDLSAATLKGCRDNNWILWSIATVIYPFCEHFAERICFEIVPRWLTAATCFKQPAWGGTSVSWSHQAGEGMFYQCLSSS